MIPAVDEILRFNRAFSHLGGKADALLASPLAFFRGTFHLFARDLADGSFDNFPFARARGPIVADLHTENFGAFRAVTNEIVYDVNDFDETTRGPYEFDLRRLATSLFLAAEENGHSFADGMAAAEAMLGEYLEALAALSRFKTRRQFAQAVSPEVARLIARAGERSRVVFMQRVVASDARRGFLIQLDSRKATGQKRFAPITETERRAIEKAVPAFLKTVMAPTGADPTRYSLFDAAFRFAGVGSIGRQRYALLFGKKPATDATFKDLRLIEWKEARPSAINPFAKSTPPGRAREVFEATRTFQLFPKRYLGCATLDHEPMQTREVGANDARFDAATFTDPRSFQAASRAFGHITARVHLLGAEESPGPRRLLTEIRGNEARFTRRVLAFAAAYSDRTWRAHNELLRRRDEVRSAWHQVSNRRSPA